MKNLRILIEESIDESTKNLLNDYWDNVDGDFKYSLTWLAKKYELKQNKITAIVMEKSYCLVDLVCSECDATVEKKIETKIWLEI